MWIDMIVSNCIIKVLDKFEHVQKEKKEKENVRSVSLEDKERVSWKKKLVNLGRKIKIRSMIF